MPDQSTRDLLINISVELEKPGPNLIWEHETVLPVPPAYRSDEEMGAFIRHELDRAMSEFQRDDFEYSRSADIIHQFDLRMRVIKNLIKFAPHALSRRALATAILGVIDMDTRDLIARYQEKRLED
jgi:hypothetical protein